MKSVLVLALALGIVSAKLTYVSMKNAAEKDGAVCLDGSPAGYYIRRNAESKGWSIHIQGGGWCFKETDCANRANNTYGSSKKWATSRNGKGSFSEDKTVNPSFYDYNLVYIPYCDGGSFTGDVAEPVVVNGQKIYFRGFRILKAVFKELLETEGMKNAENIFLSGNSAGGLSVYEHADQIASWLPTTVKRFKVSPYSGFFLKHANADGEMVYPDKMKYVFKMHNSTAGAHEGCLAAKSDDKKWECMFAPEILPYIKTPILVANSAYDEWSTRCIFTVKPVSENSSANNNCSAIPEWTDCMKTGTSCTEKQMEIINSQWGKEFLEIVRSSETLARNGNGRYIFSCHIHDGEISGYNTYLLNGKTHQQVQTEWFFSDNEPASKFTYEDCLYEKDFCCNPTCCA